MTSLQDFRGVSNISFNFLGTVVFFYHVWKKFLARTSTFFLGNMSGSISILLDLDLHIFYYPSNIRFICVNLIEKTVTVLSFYESGSSSHPLVSSQNVVLKNFANFTGKHLWRGLLFKKVASRTPVTLPKGDSSRSVSSEFCDFYIQQV